MTGMDKDNQKPMVHVEHLKSIFRYGKRDLKAVDDVSFDICAGETWAGGESGCGKTTCGANGRKAVSGYIGNHRVRWKRCGPVKDKGGDKMV